MNLDQLRGFVEVATTGHFTRAAERLHLAQPSLSRQIATLEADLGVQLLHRVRGSVALTAAGERLLPIARRMLADAAAARAEMSELVGLRSGRIRLGSTPTLSTSLVADALVEYRARYPGIDVHILERGSRRLIAALLAGELDLALIVTSVAGSEARAVLEGEPLLSERLVAVADPAQGWFTGDGPVSLHELAAMPQIVFPESYDLRATVDAAFRAADITPTIAVEGAEMDAALSFAARGIGVAIVPAMIAALNPQLESRAIAQPPGSDGAGQGQSLSRTVSIARRADMTPTHAAAAMQEVMREAADRVAAEGSSLAHLVARQGSSRRA